MLFRTMPRAFPLPIIKYSILHQGITVLRVSMALGERMGFFGLTDPWVILGYVGSLLCVAFCIIYGFLKGRGSGEEDDGE